nr:exonuclease domain-containing protein [Planococcus glaciei]
MSLSILKLQAIPPAKGDRIIQIAIITIQNDEIIDTYSEFINPERKIPAFIQDLTNIADADVADAKPLQPMQRKFPKNCRARFSWPTTPILICRFCRRN